MSELSADVADPAFLDKIRIELTIFPKLNHANFQNAVPLLKQLQIVNDSEHALSDLELVVESEPAFLKKQRWRIDAIAAQSIFPIPNLDIKLDGSHLARLTETEIATVRFSLSRIQREEPRLAVGEHQVELLPRNHWTGIQPMASLVAAFVQPNDPVIDRILKQAADVLRRNNRPASFSGYKADATQVWEVTNAIWITICKLRLDYALPAASFEQSGQKVRGPTQILQSGLATCLDSALMFCASLEQAGLNAILVITKGHAFAGFWMKLESFPNSVIYDVTDLRKRVALKEIIVFETTLVTQHNQVNFTVAIGHAVRMLEEQGENFVLAVDIQRARDERIKPLSNSEMPSLEPLAEQEVKVLSLETPGELAVDEPETEPAPNNRDRLFQWQRKLLDLTARNKLLNFQGGRLTLKIIAPDPSKLENLLAVGRELKIRVRPELMRGRDPRDIVLHESRENEHLHHAFALEALRRLEIFCDLSEMDLKSRLTELYRNSRITLQEGGANTLYLAMGFLTWTREGKDAQKYRAPLVLIPVTLHRTSARSGFHLGLHEDEPRLNPTLVEMMRQDFSLQFGILDSKLPNNNLGLDLAAIWRKIRLAIKNISGWEVVEEVHLAQFSFAKYLMWKDLAEHRANLRQNAVVRHLIDTPRDPYPKAAPFPLLKQLDLHFPPQETFCPLPSDSSQLAAVMAAVQGNDFVLIGPPGTGKSQTISNLIAQCLASGKRVLFVSEKIAALDVVYRRLREVGLGPFCLELHSNKARKLDVLAQLKNAWATSASMNREEWLAGAQRLKQLRDQLNLYVERLHHKHPNGYSIFDAIGLVLKDSAQIQIALHWPSADAHQCDDIEAMKKQAERISINAIEVGQANLRCNPLLAVGVGMEHWSPNWQNSFIASVQHLRQLAPALSEALLAYGKALHLEALPSDHKTRQALAELAEILPQAAGRDWRFALRIEARSIGEQLQAGLRLLAEHRELNARLSPLWSEQTLASSQHGLQLLRQRQLLFANLPRPWAAEIRQELQNGLKLLAKIQETTKELSATYLVKFLDLPLAKLQRDWTHAENAYWPLSYLQKRKLRLQLEPLITSEAKADFVHDLPRLLEIQLNHLEINSLYPGLGTDAVWFGTKTKAELVEAALTFQEALEHARAEQPWDETGLDALADGRCGSDLAAAFEQLRHLKALDHELLKLEALSESTAGLWVGLQTPCEIFEAALRFQFERKTIGERGALRESHSEVARARCGQEFAKDHELLQQRAELEIQLQAFAPLRDLTATLWAGFRTSIAEVERAIHFQEKCSSLLLRLAPDHEAMARTRAAIIQVIGEANPLLEPGGAIAEAGKSYQDCLAQLPPAIARVSELGAFQAADQLAFTQATLPELQERCQAMIHKQAQLKSWCAWNEARGQAHASGLGPLVESIETGALAAENAPMAFETNYCRWWLAMVAEQEPMIRTFISAEHEKRIEDFRKRDSYFTQLTREFIRHQLCADMPAEDGVSRNSQWGLLRHEIHKKKRHIPLRELIKSIPNVLNKLTPCMLMSPLSIAQYLTTETSIFDLVVFDEASQIPVWDAIGAIARGKQLVMVGDPKQLPPTNFFGRTGNDEEQAEEGLESILDECLAANLPTINLSWHYRSRNESLIAFSNHHYYEGGLVTFPSPETNDSAVSYHFIQGCYEKSGARINRIEATALVANLIAILKTPAFLSAPKTIGVVTFNKEQQTLIEDMLDDERRKDPSLEPYFSESENESIFVKNLENVQGDERDIIYFSTTFGPDDMGKVSMNFGPLNQAGGERRLNVAITRARTELRVFTSMKPDWVDLNRSQALGVRDFKRFLEYAERGQQVLGNKTRCSFGEYDSPFEEAVAKLLIQKGWMIHTQVGVSKFRIDFAVVHPDEKDSYLAGIECDGATYQGSATACDRDKLREEVLRSLGWKILRVWSTDWWIDPNGTLEKLENKLQVLLEKSRTAPQPQTTLKAVIPRRSDATPSTG